MKKLISLFIAFLGLFVFATGSAKAVSNYFNGFETDTNGWFGPITRVASGTDGITSAAGSYHAEVNADAYTQWGGYEYTFPINGYTTRVDIYLDMNLADGSDKRFDYSSAISNTTNGHRRDFIFNAGTLPGTPGTWVVSASNNSPGWPNNPGRNPVQISQTGWYTFEHIFQNNGGVLQVVMNVRDLGGNVIGTWTLSDSSDIIGTTVGGNRYGWFVDSAFPFLAIDNSEKSSNQVDICHLEKKSSDIYHKISVDIDAVAAHLRHGDAIFGAWAVNSTEREVDVTYGTHWYYDATFVQNGTVLTGSLTDPYLLSGKTKPISGSITGYHVIFSFNYGAGSIQGLRTYDGLIQSNGNLVGTWSQTGSQSTGQTFPFIIEGFADQVTCE